MAEVVSKANAFSPFNGTTNTVIHEQKHHRQQQHVRISVILRNKSANIYSRSLVLRSSSASSDFYGRKVVIGEANRGISNNTHRKAAAGASAAQVSVGIARAQRWWEKGIKRNMKEVEGPEDLVQSLLAAGDKLVVVDFFSPGCGGCKALHPKICQLAEMNPDVQFLQVNYEEHKSMCYALNVHVLPFFRFYRGAHGRLCSFSCTSATIKKFKDALAKHNSDRCSLGAPKGLEEKELAALSANKDLSFTYTAKPEQPMAVPEQEISTAPQVNSYPPLPLPLQPNSASKTIEDTKNKNLVSSGK